MSQSLFNHDPIKLPPPHSLELPQDGITFEITGKLGKDEDKKGKRQVHVFVLIQQTSNDLDPHSDTGAVAKGYHLEEGDAEQLTSWTASVKVLRGNFASGPATGTALTVEYTDDPVGFEAYTWTDRITLKQQAPTTA